MNTFKPSVKVAWPKHNYRGSQHLNVNVNNKDRNALTFCYLWSPATYNI